MSTPRISVHTIHDIIPCGGTPESALTGRQRPLEKTWAKKVTRVEVTPVRDEHGRFTYRGSPAGAAG